MTASPLAIKNAEDFWQLVQNFAGDGAPAFDKLNVKFDGWPLLHLNVKGEKFHSSLTSSMISGMASMNEAFHRAYAMAKYGAPKISLLTNEDRDALNVIFKVEEGSTESTTDWSGAANDAVSFLQKTMENMSGVEKMTVLLALITALTIGGCYFLHKKSADKKDESDARSEDIKTVIAGMKDTLLIASDLKSKGETPASREIERMSEIAKVAVLKSVADDAESVTVGGAKYSGAELLDFKARQSKNRVSRESFDNFYILGLQRATVRTTFNLLVQRSSNGESFTLKISEEMTRPEELAKLTSAMLTKEIVRISYLEVIENGVVVRGQFNLIIDDAPPTVVAS